MIIIFFQQTTFIKYSKSSVFLLQGKYEKVHFCMYIFINKFIFAHENKIFTNRFKSILIQNSQYTVHDEINEYFSSMMIKNIS